MRRSSRWLFAVALSLSALISLSASAADKPYGNVAQGDVGISGSFSLDTTWSQGSSSTTVFTVVNRTHYFIKDRLGIGGTVSLQTQSNFTALRIGPSMQYYFWMRDRVGAYFTQDVALRLYSTPGSNPSTAETASVLGVNYFITPSVAIGPSLQYFHTFGTSNIATINEFAFAGQFAIYL